MTRDINKSSVRSTDLIDASQPANEQVMSKSSYRSLRGSDNNRETILIEAIETDTVGIISICLNTVLNHAWYRFA